jgi:hypothetical protein
VTTWFRYVPRWDVEAFTARGWKLADDFKGTHHGFHAVLMIWAGEDEPAIPER